MGTKIEWATETWNPATGCTKISAGCKHCYAERMARRLKAMGRPEYRFGFKHVACHYDRLDKPRRWRKPRRVFVCSMGDLFHHDVTQSFRARVFKVMRECPWHRFLVLTKRPERLARGGYVSMWPENVWAGVTVENRGALGRIEHIRNEPMIPVRFLSCEPLLEDLGTLNLDGIGWVIVGGETGPGARSMDPAWARSIRDQCKAEGVAFFFKAMSKKAPIPGDLMIQEHPP